MQWRCGMLLPTLLRWCGFLERHWTTVTPIGKWCPPRVAFNLLSQSEGPAEPHRKLRASWKHKYALSSDVTQLPASLARSSRANDARIIRRQCLLHHLKKPKTAFFSGSINQHPAIFLPETHPINPPASDANIKKELSVGQWQTTKLARRCVEIDMACERLLANRDKARRRGRIWWKSRHWSWCSAAGKAYLVCSLRSAKIHQRDRKFYDSDQVYCVMDSGNHDGPFTVVAARISVQTNRWLYELRSGSETLTDVAESRISIARRKKWCISCILKPCGT